MLADEREVILIQWPTVLTKLCQSSVFLFFVWRTEYNGAPPVLFSFIPRLRMVISRVYRRVNMIAISLFSVLSRNLYLKLAGTWQGFAWGAKRQAPLLHNRFQRSTH